MAKTRGGVYYNLSESEYKHTYAGITFVFSSTFYRDRFIDKVDTFVNDFIINSLRDFNFMVVYDRGYECVAAVKLYTTIETRGFLIEIDNKHLIKEEFFITVNATLPF